VYLKPVYRDAAKWAALRLGEDSVAAVIEKCLQGDAATLEAVKQEFARLTGRNEQVRLLIQEALESYREYTPEERANARHQWLEADDGLEPIERKTLLALLDEADRRRGPSFVAEVEKELVDVRAWSLKLEQIREPMKMHRTVDGKTYYDPVLNKGRCTECGAILSWQWIPPFPPHLRNPENVVWLKSYCDCGASFTCQISGKQAVALGFVDESTTRAEA